MEVDGASSSVQVVQGAQGYVVLVTGVHEEAEDEDLFEAFAEYGDVSSIHLNPDRRTGDAKGYALLAFATREEAEEAIAEMNESELLGKQIKCAWAFSRGPIRLRARER